VLSYLFCKTLGVLILNESQFFAFPHDPLNYRKLLLDFGSCIYQLYWLLLPLNKQLLSSQLISVFQGLDPEKRVIPIVYYIDVETTCITRVYGAFVLTYYKYIYVRSHNLWICQPNVISCWQNRRPLKMLGAFIFCWFMIKTLKLDILTHN
jgi:hypothetical protein